MNKKRAQAAMEFLMTYGWALLVVIIVIAALAFFGLLNPQRFLPEKCEIAPGITCIDFNSKAWSTTGLGNVTILINNGLGQSMEIVSVNLTQCPYNSGFSNYTNWTSSGLVVAEGATQNITMHNCISSIVAGSRFKTDIILKYNTTIENNEIEHVKKGYIVVQAEKLG